MMDRLAALETFLTVVEVGGFAPAAHVLGIDRAVVTRRVAFLEETMQRRLLQRSTRKLALTAEGEAVIDEAERLRASANAFFSPSTLSSATGRVRVRSSFSLAAFGLAERIEAFAADHPGIEVELVTSEKLRPIVETGADLVLVVAREPEPGALARRLGSCASRIVASPEAARRTPLVYLALAGETEWHMRGGVVPLTPENAPVRYGNAWLAYAAALRGAGLARLPAVAVQRDIEVGRLVEIERSPFDEAPAAVWAVLPTRRWVKPAVRLLVEALEAWYGRPEAEDARLEVG